MRKQGKLLNLESVKVDIEDLDPNSTYFVVSNFNRTFLSGKNAFYINGSNLLKNNSQILIEVLDSKSAPLLVESHGIGTLPASGMIYSVNVFDTTANGVGKIILLGTDTNGRKVRWVSNVEINNTKINSSEVTFRSSPYMEVTPYINMTSETEVKNSTVQGVYRGVSLFPQENTSFEPQSTSNVKYLIESTTPSFTSDMNGETIFLDGEERIVKEVLNSSQMLINYPLTHADGKIRNIGSGVYRINYFPFNNPQNITINTLKPIGTAEVLFGNIETYTGKIYRYKIYRSSINAQYDLECISTGYFFGYELIYDSETPFRHLANAGRIVNETSLRNWRLVSPAGVSIRHSPEKVIDSMTTIGFKDVSNAGQGLLFKVYPIFGSDTTHGYFNLDNSSYVDRTSESYRSNAIRLYKNIEYVISYKISYEKHVTSDAHIKFYIKTSDQNATKNKNFDGTGIKIQEIVARSGSPNKNSFDVSEKFYLDEDVKGTLFIELKSIDITISNISIKPYTDFSYGPAVFTVRIPIDARAKNEGVKFTAELFDINNNYVKTQIPLVDIKYLDPDGITYPFNVFAIKTDLEILKSELNSKIDSKIEATNQNLNVLGENLAQVSGSLATVSQNVANINSIIRPNSLSLWSGNVNWTVSISGDNLSIDSNSGGRIQILNPLEMFGKLVDFGSINSGGTGYRVLRIPN